MKFAVANTHVEAYGDSVTIKIKVVEDSYSQGEMDLVLSAARLRGIAERVIQAAIDEAYARSDRDSE